MDNFIQAFAEGLDEDSEGRTKDESPASRVNVVLRSARRYVREPELEKLHFEAELKAFFAGMEAALNSLEQLHEQADEAEGILIEFSHGELELIQEEAETLYRLLESPDEGALDRVSQRLVLPTYRLLLAKDALNRLSDTRSCPYCETENPHSAERCSGCGKPLSVPDPLTQEGELFPVTPAISQLLELCFQVASHPESALKPWKAHLTGIQSTFGQALKRVEKALTQQKQGSVHDEFFEMKRGLEVMLAGLDELASFQTDLNPATLDTGWVNMMSGFKVFKLAGDRLATATSAEVGAV